MEILDNLEAYGLFDAKVPRYTSYPPANRFEQQTGAQHFPGWVENLSADKPVSVYVHIPFCKRLCWFCACRTQGTKTLSPVSAYLQDLMREIAAIARLAPTGLKMARLHLGGGTPTLLSGAQMDDLLAALHAAFTPSDDFEFSVEIDPTEASPEVLETLGGWNLGRASIGVQDFNPQVQDAIGRSQSFEQTADVVTDIRRLGVASLNFDLLYGLPHQTPRSLISTLDQATSLSPDRVALYGYAHVPHMSKRQVMIPSDTLPSARTRYVMAEIARERLIPKGYVPLGIDHFAKPTDSLAKAAARGALRRNFQGYTDDTCAALIGVGASAISAFPDGYSQNAPATAVYRENVQRLGLAAHKGILLTPHDKLIAEMISRLMCEGTLDFDALTAQFPGSGNVIKATCDRLARDYPAAVRKTGTSLTINPGYACLSRVLAHAIDQVSAPPKNVHSAAI